MNLKQQFEIQAWVDGELPWWKRRRVARLIESDPEARAEAEALRKIQTLVREEEAARKLPVSLERYWAELDAKIDRLQGERPRLDPGEALMDWVRLRWRRLLAPAAAVGAALALAWLALAPRTQPPPQADSYVEVETPLDDLGSFTFYSEAEGMTVVWVDAY